MPPGSAVRRSIGVRNHRYHIYSFKARKRRALLYRLKRAITDFAGIPLLVVVLLALAIAYRPQTGGFGDNQAKNAGIEYRVIDGDTIKSNDGMRYRLLGFDTPETHPPRCERERELGQRATNRLKELLSSGDARLIESGRVDRYGRKLAWLTVDNRDVGDILISEGLARAYHGGQRATWCD